MSIPRTYQALPLALATEVQLDKAAMHHFTNVLRKNLGDTVLIFNGDGQEYLGKITHISKTSLTVYVEEVSTPNTESPLAIHLAQGISRGEKMDYTVQKAVELGARTITPLFTERCHFKLNAEQKNKKMQHWQAIAISACEQSGRIQIPTLFPALNLTTWLTTSHAELKLVLNPYTDQTLSSIQQTLHTRPGSIIFLIGPEGGLSAEELQLAEQNGFLSLKLGPRILRTETAALVAMSAIQSLWGDLA